MEIERFEQLLTAELDGELASAERAELDAACADDPVLTRLRRQDVQLAALLRRSGPERAPDDLAADVMTRLRTETAVTVSAGDEAARDEMERELKPPRIIPPPVEPAEAVPFWVRLFGMPAVRWGFGVAVVAVVAFQGFQVFGPGRSLDQIQGDGTQIAGVASPGPADLPSAPILPPIPAPPPPADEAPALPLPPGGTPAPVRIAAAETPAATPAPGAGRGRVIEQTLANPPANREDVAIPPPGAVQAEAARTLQDEGPALLSIQIAQAPPGAGPTPRPRTVIGANRGIVRGLRGQGGAGAAPPRDWVRRIQTVLTGTLDEPRGEIVSTTPDAANPAITRIVCRMTDAQMRDALSDLQAMGLLESAARTEAGAPQAAGSFRFERGAPPATPPPGQRPSEIRRFEIAIQFTGQAAN